MDARQEILGLPRALEETLVMGRIEYEALVRRTRWGEGPIFVVGSGPAYLVALTAVCGFEALLGWPVVARPTPVFGAYCLELLRPRSVVLAVAGPEDAEETLDVLRAARARGAVVLAVTSDAASPLAQAAEGVFLARSGESSGSGVKALVVGAAAVALVSLVAASVLKRPHPRLDELEEEFVKLPGHVEWVLTQMTEAVRSLASEFRGARALRFAGAGFYQAAAHQAAFVVRRLAAREVRALDFSEFPDDAGAAPGTGEVVAFLSGSRCRLKRDAERMAARAVGSGARVISLTDANDRELAERSALAVRLPILPETTGSTLALALVSSVAAQMARDEGRKPSAVKS